MGLLMPESGGKSIYSHDIQLQVMDGLRGLLTGFFNQHPEVGFAIGQADGHQGHIGFLYKRPDNPMGPLPENGLSITGSDILDLAGSQSFNIKAEGTLAFTESGKDWGTVHREDLDSAVIAAWNNATG